MITEQAKQAAVTLLHLLDKQADNGDGYGRRPLRTVMGMDDDVVAMWAALQDNDGNEFWLTADYVCDRLGEVGVAAGGCETYQAEGWDYSVPGIDAAYHEMRKLVKENL